MRQFRRGLRRCRSNFQARATPATEKRLFWGRLLDIEGAEVEMAPALRLDGVEKLLIELHPHVTGNDAANGVVQQFVQKGFLVDFYKSKLNQIYMTR